MVSLSGSVSGVSPTMSGPIPPATGVCFRLRFETVDEWKDPLALVGNARNCDTTPLGLRRGDHLLELALVAISLRIRRNGGFLPLAAEYPPPRRGFFLGGARDHHSCSEAMPTALRLPSASPSTNMQRCDRALFSSSSFSLRTSPAGRPDHAKENRRISP
jgi:hypothetical protein